MKTKENIIEELTKNGWVFDKNDKDLDRLLSALNNTIKDDEMVLSGILGKKLDENGKATETQELLVVTNKRVISVFDAKVGDEEPKVHARSLKTIHKVLTQPSSNMPNAKRIDVLLTNSTWSVEVITNDSIKHFEDSLKQFMDDDKVDDQTFDTTSKAETINIKNNPKKARINKEKSTFWSNTKNKTTGLFRNLTVWNFLSFFMALGIMITAAVYVGINQPKKEVYIPAGVFQAIFAVVGLLVMVVLAMNDWDKHEFSFELYRSLFGLLVYLLFFIFGIIMSTNATGTNALQAITIVLSTFMIFDSGYALAKHYFG